MVNASSLTAGACPAVEAQEMVRSAAEPIQPTDSVKARILRAAGVLGLGYSRARQAWYGEPAAWQAAEMDAMRARYRAALLARLAREEAALAVLRARIAGAAGERA